MEGRGGAVRDRDMAIERGKKKLVGRRLMLGNDVLKGRIARGVIQTGVAERTASPLRAEETTSLALRRRRSISRGMHRSRGTFAGFAAPPCRQSFPANPWHAMGTLRPEPSFKLLHVNEPRF